MKKTLFLLIILTILVTPSLGFASFDVSLKYGAKGEAVEELQDFLQDQNFYSAKIDGKFGLGTVKAVKAFQVANNLTADGYFGVSSRTKASSLLADILKPSDDAEKLEVGVNVLPGCTSTSGFSTTTGHSCALSMNLPAGCTTTSGFSITTGSKCDGTIPVSTQLAEVNTSLNQIAVNTTPQPPLPDVCSNIEGNQSTIPSGMELKDGQCVAVVVTPPAPVSKKDIKFVVTKTGDNNYDYYAVVYDDTGKSIMSKVYFHAGVEYACGCGGQMDAKTGRSIQLSPSEYEIRYIVTGSYPGPKMTVEATAIDLVKTFDFPQ